MAGLYEFYIPNRLCELTEKGESLTDQYTVCEDGDFDVSPSQQLDDITRLFDELQHEKSPTALFTRKELFEILFCYLKGMYSSATNVYVIRSVRHKICHEISERLKKLLQVTVAYIKKKENSVNTKNATLEICLRSTLKMYAFIICTVLLTESPTNSEEECADVNSTERNLCKRNRRREANSGFADDSSGVDLDGRELALSALIDFFTTDVVTLWPEKRLESNFLQLVYKLCLHMVAQKANINNEAQSISSSLALLLTRVCANLLNCFNNNIESIISPLVEISIKSEHAALFLSNFIADLEQETDNVTNLPLESSISTIVTSETASEINLVHPQSEIAVCMSNITTPVPQLIQDKLLYGLFNQVTENALQEATSDAALAKNISIFMTEVAKKCITAIIKVAHIFDKLIECESYDIRKASITCIAEITLQQHSLLNQKSDEIKNRNKYLNELLFRMMDVNAFVRNHTIHIWKRLIESRVVPKRYQNALVDVIVKRLEDRNYLVRDAAMTAISLILRKNWFGHVLNKSLLQQKCEESVHEAQAKFDSHSEFHKYLCKVREEFQPIENLSCQTVDVVDDENKDDNHDNNNQRQNYLSDNSINASNDNDDELMLNSLNGEQVSAINKVLFYENALLFVDKVILAVKYACALLDSRTERDVVEAIKLIVTVTECHLENSDAALLKVLSLVFDGELKIQLTVCDAFAEVIFGSYARLETSTITRSSASAQKLISILRCATEGDISAIEKIINLLVTHSSSTRYINSHFIDAIWLIAEGSVDIMSTTTDRRTAMRIYSIISKYHPKDVHSRKDAILLLLESITNNAEECDNILISYIFAALQNLTLQQEFMCYNSSTNPCLHKILKLILLHLVRPTNLVESWIQLAISGINFLCEFCELPILMFKYIITCVAERALANDDTNARAQLFFILGHTALKQLGCIERAEKMMVKELETANDSGRQRSIHNSALTSYGNKKISRKFTSSDNMGKELGLESSEYKRHVIQELAIERRRAILSDDESIWKKFSNLIIEECTRPLNRLEEQRFDYVCAVMTLCKLMVVSEEFCSENLETIFTIVSDAKQSWVVRTNIIVALGDLACVHPNLLAPFLSSADTGFLKLLNDDDLRVRAAAIQVCSHLVLGEMLRLRDHLYLIVKLVADPDNSIAENALSFVQNLAIKEKERSGNLIPPLITQLSNEMPVEKLKSALHILLEKVEGDKPVDSLIERLCQRFEPFSERNKKKINIAIIISFCLAELNYSTERAVRRIMSEVCYQQYRHWLRNENVFAYFKTISMKARKSGRFASDRRDKSIIEEWEHRLMADAGSESIKRT